MIGLVRDMLGLEIACITCGIWSSDLPVSLVAESIERCDEIGIHSTFLPGSLSIMARVLHA